MQGKICILFAAGMALAVAVVGVQDSFGHGSGGDIALFTTPDGLQVDVGFAILDDDDIHQEFFDPNVNVFHSILLPRTPSVLPPIPYTIGSPEPGFDANEGQLPPLALVTFNTLELSYWDGGGPVSFGPAAGISGGYAPQPSITFADGGYHAHPVFGLQGASIPDGVYLAELTVSVAGLADSAPYYLVALVDSGLYTGNSEMDAENAEAVGDLVIAYLDDPHGAPEPIFGGRNYRFFADAIAHARSLAIPEPSSLVLLTIAMAAVANGRRRAR
jgi:hypothetical protein